MRTKPAKALATRPGGMSGGRWPALCAALCLLVAGPGALAGGDRVFTVERVAVDVTARTAARARSLAIAEGQREALDSLFARLTLREDADRLPLLDDTGVTNLVSGLEFDEERTSSKRYLANLTVRFNAERVRNLLRITGIPFSETMAKPILVVPVYEAAGLSVLWEDPNPLREAWREYGRRGGLLPFVVPLGDLTDVAAIGTRDALEINRQRLAAVADRYRANDILVVTGVQDYKVGGREPVLAVDLRRINDAGEWALSDTFTIDGSSDPNAVITAAVAALAGDLEEEWKLKTLIEFGTEITLEARVPLVDLRHWLDVRSRLGGIAAIRRVDLLSLTVNEARVVLHYLGNPGQLMVALSQSDIDLVESDGKYSIMLARDEAE